MRKALFTSALLALMGTSAYAGNYNSVLNIYGGYNFTDSDCIFDDAPVVGVNLGTFFNSNWGLRAGYERVIDADLTDGAKTLEGDTSVDVNRFALNAIYKRSKPWKKVIPYALAGVGYENYEDGVIRGGASCSGQWFWDAGVGLSTSLADNWGLNAEVRALGKDKCDTIDIVPTIGLSYMFGAGTRVIEKVVVKEKIVNLPCPQPEPIYDPKEDAVR